MPWPNSTAKDPALPGARDDELGALATRVVAGDGVALRAFLTSLVPHLLRVARRVLGPSHPFVEDVAHDAAYTVVSQLPQFRGEGSLLNFSRGIAVHTALNMRRRDQARKRARVRANVDADDLVAQGPDPETRAAHRAVLPAVREVLDELPEVLAEVFVLHLLFGHTVVEVAEIAKAPVETVRSRLRLAKERFKARAAEHPILRDELRFDP